MEYELYVLCYYGSIVHFLMCDTGTGYIGDGECPLLLRNFHGNSPGFLSGSVVKNPPATQETQV